MASVPNPMAALAARQLISRLGGAGGPVGQQAGGPQPDAILQQQMSQLRGSNPQSILRQLQQMRRIASVMVPFTAEAVPGVAKNMMQVLRGLDGAIKEAEKASSLVGMSSPPIQNSAIPSAGAPGAAGQEPLRI